MESAQQPTVEAGQDLREVAKRLKGQGVADVSFAEHGEKWQLPTQDMSMKDFDANIMKALSLLERGLSLAVACGDTVRGVSHADAEKRAVDGMRHIERVLYWTWKADGIRPDFDWSRRPNVPDDSGYSDETLDEYAASLKHIYFRQEVTRGQAYAWVKANDDLISLVTAVARYLRALRDLTSGDTAMTPEQWLERQVCNKLVQEIGKKRSAIASEIARFNEDTTVVEKATQVRLNTLPLPTGKKRRVEVPEQNALKKVGKTYANPATNLGELTSGKRLERTTHTAGASTSEDALPLEEKLATYTDDYLESLTVGQLASMLANPQIVRHTAIATRLGGRMNQIVVHSENQERRRKQKKPVMEESMEVDVEATEGSGSGKQAQ